MGAMITGISIWSILIICGGVFLASVVDAIGGGGGLISLPAYLLAGLPMHNALGTNKMSSAIGTTVSTIRYICRGFISWKLVGPSIVLAIAGASLGAKLQLALDEKYSKYVLIGVLVIVAVVMLRDKDFSPRGPENPKAQAAIVWASSLILGMYDGFYGPGTGTFLLLTYCKLARMDLNEAAGTVKLVNLSSNIGALFTMLTAGKVLIPIGILASVFSITGHYLGAGLMIKNGKKIVRPIILTVLALLFVRLIGEAAGIL